MNNMRFFMPFVVLVFSSICFNGCRNVKNQKIEKNDNIKTVIIPKVVDAEDVDIISDLDYIVLEAKENSYFGNVTKMRVYQNKIYILDEMHANALFIYTIEGKHIATIGDKKGRGPLEFESVKNFEIDYANNQLAVIDNFGYKIMIYDLEGKFIKRINSEMTVLNTVLLPNGNILHAKPTGDYNAPLTSNCQIIITGENNQIIKEAFEYDDNKNLNIHIPEIITAQFDGGFNFAPKFRDTIYHVSSESITPKYAINYGDNRKIPKSTINTLSDIRDLYKLIKNGNTCFLGTHVESKDFLYLSLGFPYPIYVFYNKDIDKTIAISTKANITEYKFELYQIGCSDADGYFYGAFNFADIDEVSKLFPELKKIDTKEEPNPILFRYKVKL